MGGLKTGGGGRGEGVWEDVLRVRWGVTVELRAVVFNGQLGRGGGRWSRRGGGCHFAPSGHLAMSEDTSIFNWEGVGEEKSGQDMGI